MRKQLSNKFISWRNGTLLALLVAMGACTKSSTPNGGGSNAITSFSFQTTGNQIPVSSQASIKGPNIALFLPPGTNTGALVASFSVSGTATVTVNGVAQTSGVTPNNFTAPVTYTVTTPGDEPQTFSVSVTTGFPAIDQNVAAFMTQYNIPGMAIAITLNDKLVYVNSYGKASVENNQSVTSQSLFRISSLSKQITSVAIMRLLDQGKISLNQPVFGTGSILGNAYGSQPYGPGVTNITIGELLHHTEGGWPDNSTDPFGSNFSYSIPQLVSWGLNNVPLLDTIPGRSYNYSHFGYVILGRVIEKITGVSYSQAVQQLVLQPSGITDMQIAGNTLSARLPNEVEYYGQNDENPYYIPISRMDAANGWVASATDLARFLVHVDGLSNLTILSSNAFKAMTTGSYANPRYACGWEINQLNMFHHGLWPGTGSSQAITTQNGNFNYIILANTGSSDPSFGSNMDNIFWSALNNIQTWPGYDLFQQQAASEKTN
jgi:D-alanyl-D-alanine carboxypeptidase